MGRVLVVGGGAAGLAAAWQVADSGLEVLLVEKQQFLGGMALHYNCKRVGDHCTQCGVCAVYDLMARVERSPRVSVVTGRAVTSFERRGETFVAEIEGRGQEAVDAIILATGFSFFDAARMPELGYGRLPRVLNALDLEERVRSSGGFSFLGARPRVAFVQCVGSRRADGRGPAYCSRVCCLYTAKIAGCLREQNPYARIDVYCLDCQSYPDVYQAAWPEGIRLFRGMPARVIAGEWGDYRLPVDTGSGLSVEEYDWVILAPALIPSAATVDLARQAGLDRNEDGFLGTLHGVVTSQPGVFAAGSCRGPLSFLECIENGVAAAGRLLDHVRGGMGANA